MEFIMAYNVRVYAMLRLKGAIWVERSGTAYTLLYDVVKSNFPSVNLNTYGNF